MVWEDGHITRKPLDHNTAAGDNAGFHHMHRMDLLMCLHKRALEFAPETGANCPIQVHFDKRLTAVFERAGMREGFRRAQVEIARERYWPGDDRVTRVGRFLRQTCLDELPQLWDVLCGRMSLVGPRPHPLQLEVEGQPIESLIPDYHQRHSVRPGITGLAQIRGNRGPLETLAMGRERVRYDVEYIEGHSLWLDIRILFKTLVVPFQKDGSY